MQAAPFGLRVLGCASGRREVVSFERAARLYANADPAVSPQVPAFLSAFRYPVDLKTHVVKTGGTAGYLGPVGVDAVYFDIDRQNLVDAILAARRLTTRVAERWGLDDNDMVVAFSGSKGFHLTVPTTGIDPAPDNHSIARHLAASVAREIGVDIDESVYLPTQLWRAPNSRHARTGHHKVRVDADDLLRITPEAIYRLAAEPIPYDPPVSLANRRLLDEWERSARAVREDHARRAQNRGIAPRDGRPGGKINGLTWSILREGADPGERHRLIFSAAANLAEFSALDDLIMALLMEVGLDTGLPHGEVARQIECGIRHARRHVEGGAA